MEDFGLHYYVARWYDPCINMFTQPDTIIPDPGNSMDWNRYAYVNYNPINFNDPTGHYSDSDIQKFLQNDSSWWSYTNYPYGNGTQYDLGKKYGVGQTHDDITPGGGATCALRNTAEAAGLNPHDVYYSFAQDNMGLPNSWWTGTEMAEFVNTNDLFQNWSAEFGTFDDFFNSYAPDDIGGYSEFLEYLLDNGNAVIAMVSADTSGALLTDAALRNSDNNHWVTITNVSSVESGTTIATYYDSMTDSYKEDSWYNFYYLAWANEPTLTHMVVLSRLKGE